MGMPKRVHVLGVPYKIVAAPHSDMGCTTVDSQTITIHPTQGPDQLRRTVLHEVLHAVVEGSGLGKWLGSSESEEFAVAVLDSALYQLIRDNPALVDFLCER